MIAIPDGGLGDSLAGVNLPGVLLLATSGVGAMFFIVRWMMRFQREFTDVYVAENVKLRERVESLESRIAEKIQATNRAERDLLRIEADSERRIQELEAQIRRHEATIADHQQTISELSRRHRDSGPVTEPEGETP